MEGKKEHLITHFFFHFDMVLKISLFWQMCSKTKVSNNLHIFDKISNLQHKIIINILIFQLFSQKLSLAFNSVFTVEVVVKLI